MFHYANVCHITVIYQKKGMGRYFFHHKGNFFHAFFFLLCISSVLFNIDKMPNPSNQIVKNFISILHSRFFEHCNALLSHFSGLISPQTSWVAFVLGPSAEWHSVFHHGQMTSFYSRTRRVWSFTFLLLAFWMRGRHTVLKLCCTSQMCVHVCMYPILWPIKSVNY